MSSNIDYDIIKDILLGDFRSENDLVVVLNFLKHLSSVIRILHLVQRTRNESYDLNDKKHRSLSIDNHS